MGAMSLILVASLFIFLALGGLSLLPILRFVLNKWDDHSAAFDFPLSLCTFVGIVLGLSMFWPNEHPILFLLAVTLLCIVLGFVIPYGLAGLKSNIVLEPEIDFRQPLVSFYLQKQRPKSRYGKMVKHIRRNASIFFPTKKHLVWCVGFGGLIVLNLIHQSFTPDILMETGDELGQVAIMQRSLAGAGSLSELKPLLNPVSFFYYQMFTPFYKAWLFFTNLEAAELGGMGIHLLRAATGAFVGLLLLGNVSQLSNHLGLKNLKWFKVLGYSCLIFGSILLAPQECFWIISIIAISYLGQLGVFHLVGVNADSRAAYHMTTASLQVGLLFVAAFIFNSTALWLSFAGLFALAASGPLVYLRDLRGKRNVLIPVYILTGLLLVSITASVITRIQYLNKNVPIAGITLQGFAYVEKLHPFDSTLSRHLRPKHLGLTLSAKANAGEKKTTVRLLEACLVDKDSNLTLPGRVSVLSGHPSECSRTNHLAERVYTNLDENIETLKQVLKKRGVTHIIIGEREKEMYSADLTQLAQRFGKTTLETNGYGIIEVQF